MADFESSAQIKPAELHFNDKEATFGVLLFIIFQMVLIYIARGIVSAGIPYNTVFSEILSAIIEGSFVLAVFVIAKYRKKNFIKAAGLNKKINGKIVLAGLVICLICLIGLSRVSSLFLDILTFIGYNQSASSISVNTVWDLIVYTFLVALIPAICEEIMFRGLILGGLARCGKHFAVIISALLFMLMHGSPDQTVHQFILGIIFGYIVYFTGNVLITIIIHFFNNFIVLAINFVYNIISPGASDAGSAAGTSSVIVTIVSVLISAAIVCIAVYLLVIEIKKISSLSNQINGEPEYLSYLDKRALSEKLNSATEMKQTFEFEVDENGVVLEQERASFSRKALIYLIVGVCYLGIEWIIALINGFVS